MKKLIIDAQVFHTPALHRGMGKYSLELLQALCDLHKKDNYWQSIELVLSSKLPLKDEADNALRSIAESTITKLPLKKDSIYKTRRIMQRNQSVIDRYIENQPPNAEIDYLILSPMQGGIVSVFPTGSVVRKMAICYDLIPFMFHQTYFQNDIARIENLTKLTEFLKADIYLTISKTVANDLAVNLGIDPARIHSIDGGPINHAKHSNPIKVNKPFILMPTGNDLRKNNRSGVLGFGEFNKRHSNKYSLVITSSFDPEEVKELSKLTNNVLFTGNISGEELNYLYEECEILLFPSEYEGLGLPVLEAVQKNKPVACSDISVFREMSKTSFSYFDPKLSTSIAESLDRCLTREVNKKSYQKILSKYSWEVTAAKTIEAVKLPFEKQAADKPRVAIFGPNPAHNSRLSRILQLSYAELLRYIRPTYFIEGADQGLNAPRPNLLQFTKHYTNITDQTAINLDSQDIAVYNIVNSDLCAKTLFTALANPGIVILHNLDLNHVWQAMVARGLINQQRLDWEEKLQQRTIDSKTNLLCSLVANQRAIIVFSEKAKQAISDIQKALNVSIPVEVASMPFTSLVYDDISPSKGNIVGYFEDGDENLAKPLFNNLEASSYAKLIIDEHGQNFSREVETINTQNDYQFEEAISRLDCSVAASNEQLLSACEGLRYGVLPIYREGDKSVNWELPNSFIKTMNVGEASNILNGFVWDELKYQASSKKSKTELAEKHRYKLFAKSVYSLINNVGKTGEPLSN